MAGKADERVADLLELERFHLAEARRVRNAIDLLKSIAHRKRSVDATMRTVRARVAAERPVAPTPRPHAGRYGRQRAAKEAGTRPVDVVSRVLIEARGEPLTRAQLLERTNLPAGKGRGGVERTLGLALRFLRDAKAVKAKGDGFVATARLLNSVNGTDATT